MKNTISENFDTQIKMPKPILMEIFMECGLSNFLRISLTSKQFYFLLKSDNFWMKMLKGTDLKEDQIEKERKTKTFVEIYRESLMGWDVNASHNQAYNFFGKIIVHNMSKDLAAAVSKRTFITGEENLVFIFKINASRNLSACGICVNGSYFLFLFYYLKIFALNHLLL